MVAGGNLSYSHPEGRNAEIFGSTLRHSACRRSFAAHSLLDVLLGLNRSAIILVDYRPIKPLKDGSSTNFTRTLLDVYLLLMRGG